MFLKYTTTAAKCKGRIQYMKIRFLYDALHAIRNATDSSFYLF